jgi:hypothetical protein
MTEAQSMTHTITITLTLSDEMLGQYEREAQRSHQQIGDVIADDLLALQPTAENIQARLSQLDAYMDAQLVALAQSTLTPEQAARQITLAEKLESSTLTSAEKQEHTYLARRIEVQALLRARALVLLQARGHVITPYLETLDDPDS